MASEQFSLCWDNFHKNMSSGMQSLLESEDLVDVTLAVEGRYLKAHKMVLSVCSPYFRELFQSNPCKHPIVFMKDVSYIALSDLLQFMYQGEVQVAQENLTTFIKTAEALQIKGLTGDSNSQNESETPEPPEIEKPVVETIKRSHEVVVTKPVPTARVKKPAGPASKRARFILPATESSSVISPVSASTLVAATGTKPEVSSVNAVPTSDEIIQFKMEPTESADQSHVEGLDDSQADRYGDESTMDDIQDDTEDYSLMETGDDEPKAGTSADGMGDGQVRVDESMFHHAIYGLTEQQIENTPAGIHCRRETENLRSILEKSNKGKSVLHYYEQNRSFTKFTRDKLVESIIENILEENVDSRITVQTFQDISNSIVQMFPTEIREIYFAVNRKNIRGKIHKTSTGKLFSKYYNMRRQFKKTGLLASNKESPDVNFYGGDDGDEEQNGALTWLRNSSDPWPQVQTFWNDTFCLRNKHLTNEEGSIQSYMGLYPALKHRLGYTLLEQDFNKLHPDYELKLYSNWPIFSENIVRYAKTLKDKTINKKLVEIQNDTRQDVKTSRILFLLPYLMNPLTIRKEGGGCWKPSKLEVQEGFIIHLKTISELKTTREARKQKIRSYGITLQPTPIIVGEDLENITSSYVAVNDILYEVTTPLEAVDVCFKIIHAVQSRYPAECEHVWFLIQQGVYGIKTKWDKHFSCVNQLLVELKM